MTKANETQSEAIATLPKLSDGRTFRVLHTAKTRDLRNAQRQAGPKHPEDVVYYLVSLLVEVDGTFLTFEDVMDLDLDDFNTLAQEVQGSKGESNTQPGKA